MEMFENIDENLEEKDPSKAGFSDVWIGIANATNHSFSIETHIESSVPDETSGESETNVKANNLY